MNCTKKMVDELCMLVFMDDINQIIFCRWRIWSNLAINFVISGPSHSK